MDRKSIGSTSMSIKKPRRGAMVPLLCICMVVIVGMMAFAVDVSYMHTLRTELRLASDAAVRSGTETLRRTQSTEEAINKAIEIAALNKVGGRSVVLSRQDIQLGQTEYQTDGTWKFVEGRTPVQALRVNVRFGPGSPNPSIPLFFGKFWGIQNVASNSEAVAAHFDQDIVLCLDRSHSMCFDLSGQDWEYPPETRRRRGDPYLMKPGAQNSRWAALQRGVDVFVEEVEQVNTKPQVALVTWASEIRVSNAENLPSPYLSPRVTVEEEFTTNFNQLSNKTKAKGGRGMMGGTDMSSGIRAAMERFGLGAARPLARKTIILMTDGQWNMGTNPVDLAREAARQGITIHTLTFLDRGATTDMIEIAKVTGGKHFHAKDEAELQEAFRDLARLLPVVLTE